MSDRVYPSTKPQTATATATVTATTPKPTLTPPPNKTNTTNTNTNSNRRPHRPNPSTNNQTQTQTRRRSRRGCFCLCCFWSILIIILLLLIATVAGCILYLLYRPHRPTFAIAALKIQEFKFTTTNDDTTTLTSKLNITISTKNSNKKIIFYYEPLAITCLCDETVIAKGSFYHSLVTSPNNITIIRTSLSSSKSMLMETQSVTQIKSHLKTKSGLPLKIFVDTEARVKIESLRTKKVGIRIKCEGIHSLVPKSNTGKSRNSTSYVAANVSGVKCKFDLRIKIWKWTF